VRSNPALLAIVAEGFLSRLAFGIVGFTLPLYAFSLHLSLAQIGLLVSVSAVVGMLLKPLMGWVADRHGLKRCLTVAIALRSLLCLSYALAVSPWQLYGIRGGHGVADSLRDPAINALIAELGGKKAIASTFAWYQTAKTFAGSVGKGAAGVALTATGDRFSVIFGAAFILSALPLAIVTTCVREPDRSTAPEAEPVADAARPPGTVRFAVLGGLISGSSSMLGVLFPVLATQYAGLSAAEAGLLYLAAPFLAFTGPAFGWLSDHVDHRFVLSLRSVANTLSSVLFLVSPSFLGFFVGKALDDLGKAAFRPAWGAMMAHVSSFDRRSRARVMSVLSMGEDAGDIIAPIIAGLLFSWQGATALLLGRLGIAMAAEGYAHLVTKWMHRPAGQAAPAAPERRPRAIARRQAGRSRMLDSLPENRRVYVVGGEVLDASVDRRPYPGQPSPVDPALRDGALRDGALRDVALRHGDGLGAEVYELEVVDSAHGPVVVNLGPGRGSPAADTW
jgi:MFS family permease